MYKPTGLFIVIGIAAIAIFDSWVFAKYGYDATISHTLTALSADWPVIPFVFGFIAGHLFFGRPTRNKESQ